MKKADPKASQFQDQYTYLPATHLNEKLSLALAETKSKAGRRITEYLADKHRPCSTSELCRQCSCGNISAAVSCLNPTLESYGFKIVNFAPHTPIENKFGERSPMHLWVLIGGGK